MIPPANEGAQRVFGQLLQAHTGQQLLPGRIWRVETSLRPIVRELGLASLDALADRAISGRDPKLANRIVEALLNNESSFFRDPGVFELLNRDGFDRLRTLRKDVKRLRIWSAGCSTGQEAYSLAMMIRDDEPRWAGWHTDIAATDISHATIASARAGRYSQFEVQRGLPVRTMLRWFTQAKDDWTIDPALRRRVRFAQHNLLDPAPGRFDLILCRNVLMYFAPPVRAMVFARLAEALEPGGLLMLGAGETVIGQTDAFASVSGLRGLYVRQDKRLPAEANPNRRVA